jgi:hypothetical protein
MREDWVILIVPGEEGRYFFIGRRMAPAGYVLGLSRRYVDRGRHCAACSVRMCA